jgi:hypothetical protein
MPLTNKFVISCYFTAVDVLLHKPRVLVWAAVHTCALVLSADGNIIWSRDNISVPCVPSRDPMVTANNTVR